VNGFADWREVLCIIEDYAASTRAPVREHTEVTDLRAGNGGFVLSVPDGTIHARRVVVATGPFQRPRIPDYSKDVAPSVLQTDPTRYRCPEELPDGAVLVVGSGASGCQIGEELLRAGRTVFLPCGARAALGVTVETSHRVEALPESPVIVATELADARRLLADDQLVWQSGHTVCLDLGLRTRRGDPFVVSDLDEAGWVERFTRPIRRWPLTAKS
jgi:glycine/D-amino acid oxidase-like deaminating enzyme